MTKFNYGMRGAQCHLLVTLAMIPASPLAAQHRAPSLAIGAGVLFADDGNSAYLDSRGISAFVRLGWSSVPLVLEASVESVPQNNDILFAPCLPPPAVCAAPFVGPSTALTFAPALQTTARAPVASWLFRFGPSLSWLVDRQPASDPLAIGWRAGTSVRTGHTNSGFLLSLDYYHLFRKGMAPDWFLPITIGWQF